MKSKNIYFAFPYKGVGGVSLLFLRIADALFSMGYKNLYLIDYKDGFMSINNKNPKIKVLEYGKSSIKIQKDSFIIFQTMTPWSIYPDIELRPESKVFFWNCHPMNLLPRAPIFDLRLYNYDFLGKAYLNSLLFFHKKTLKNFLKILVRKKSIAFMDAENIRITKKFLGSFDTVKFLPIPTSNNKKGFVQPTTKKDSLLNVLYVGRIESFKVPPLKRFIKDLEEYGNSNKQKFKMTIIGEGSDKLYLVNYCKKFKNIRFSFIDFLEPKELQDFIYDEIDICAAMGTSALESAKCSKPTILLDFSYMAIKKGYKYKWIFETKKYNLTEFISRSSHGSGEHSLESIFTQFYNNHIVLAEKSYNYYLNNHNIDSIAEKFIKLLDESECTWHDLKKSKVLSRGIIYNLYSIFK